MFLSLGKDLSALCPGGYTASSLPTSQETTAEDTETATTSVVLLQFSPVANLAAEPWGKITKLKGKRKCSASQTHLEVLIQAMSYTDICHHPERGELERGCLPTRLVSTVLQAVPACVSGMKGSLTLP